MATNNRMRLEWKTGWWVEDIGKIKYFWKDGVPRCYYNIDTGRITKTVACQLYFQLQQLTKPYEYMLKLEGLWD